MGPDFTSLTGFIKQVADIFSVDIEELIELEEGIYWI
jgi:hypothetical protein